MIKASLLLLMLLVAPLSAQQLTLSLDEINDTALLTTLNNYFGCKVWSSDVCLQCSDRYYFNSKGICCEVEGTCQQFNTQQGICEQCYQGYSVVNGKCAKVQKKSQQNIGCATWKKGVCTQCSKRWYFSNSICTPISDLCSTWDDSGACLSCYYGYKVQAGACVVDDDRIVMANSNLLCKTWNGTTCVQCADRSYFNAEGICNSVSAQCNTFDKASGNCLTCFKGYDLKNGKCLSSDSNNAKSADSGCGTWDWDKQVCQKCSSHWFFNENKVCVPVSDQCKSSIENGACDSCYVGYDLVQGKCIFSGFNNAFPSGSGCGTWDWTNQACVKCSKRWVFNNENVCVPVSDQCVTHADNGNCLTCFKGYDLKNGQCLFSDSNNAKPSDSGCGTWDWANQQCLKCSNGWVLNPAGACVPFSDQCVTHADNGDCLTCYKGYDVKKGQCIFSDSNNAKPLDSGCGTWDWDNQKCMKCSKGWVFNANNLCVPVSDQCASHADNGDCLTCFKGYELKNGQCLFSDSNNAKPLDSGCGTWDWDNQKCIKCSKGWVFNANNVCVPVSDQCASHAGNGDCLTCYKGYDLRNGKCLFSGSNNARPSDLGCGTWDWDNQICLACSKGWVFNAKKVCEAVSDLCRTNAGNGDCTSCYDGYDLKNGRCLFSESNNARPSDLGCGTWDWKNQICLKCSNRWFFNQKKRCVPVDDNCNNYADSGKCTSCYPGYSLSKGTCQSFNPLCKTLNADGTCATCYPQNIRHNGNCVPIGKLANIMLYYAECCPEKLQAMQAQQTGN